MATMTKADLHHLLSTLEAVETELEELIYEKEWYVTDVIDQVKSSLELVNSQIKEIK